MEAIGIPSPKGPSKESNTAARGQAFILTEDKEKG